MGYRDMGCGLGDSISGDTSWDVVSDVLEVEGGFSDDVTVGSRVSPVWFPGMHTATGFGVSAGWASSVCGTLSPFKS